MASPEDIDGTGPAPRRKRLTPRAKRHLDAIEFGHDLRPVMDRPYLIKGLIDMGGLSILVGPPGTAKTFLGIDFCHHVYEGATWAGQRVGQAQCLYIAQEGGLMFANRMAARKARFALMRAPITLGGQNGSDAPSLAEVVNHMAETQGVAYGLIVVDTLARAMGGADENAGPDMGALLRSVDHLRAETGAHVMLIHHTGKDATKGARGHSSLFGAVDTELSLSVDRESKRRMLTVTKQRDGEDGMEFGFRLKKVDLGRDKDGDTVWSCVVEHDEVTQPTMF
jgi:hypothetical protein